MERVIPVGEQRYFYNLQVNGERTRAQLLVPPPGQLTVGLLLINRFPILKCIINRFYYYLSIGSPIVYQ